MNYDLLLSYSILKPEKIPFKVFASDSGICSCRLPRDYTHPIRSLVVIDAAFNDPRKAENLTIQMLFTARFYHKRFRSCHVLLTFCKTCASVYVRVSIDATFGLASMLRSVSVDATLC